MRANKKPVPARTERTSEADHGFMKRALELSRLAVNEGHGHPFGSVVVRDGKIVGEGWNRSRVSNDPSAHAEVEAIRDACKNLAISELEGCTIYASAEPCPMCLSLIYLTGIQKVFYCIPHSKIEAFNNELSVDYIYQQLKKPQNERTIPEIQILAEEADNFLGSYIVRR